MSDEPHGEGDARQHLIQLWVSSDEDPDQLDWQGLLPAEFRVDFSRVRTFPRSSIHHEITWWITRPLTLKEWLKLSRAEDKVLSRIVGDNFQGMAGPIPIPEDL